MEGFQRHLRTSFGHGGAFLLLLEQFSSPLVGGYVACSAVRWLLALKRWRNSRFILIQGFQTRPRPSLGHRSVRLVDSRDEETYHLEGRIVY